MFLNRPIRRYRDLALLMGQQTSYMVVSTRAFGVASYRVSCPCMPSTATFSEQYRYRTSHRAAGAIEGHLCFRVS